METDTDLIRRNPQRITGVLVEYAEDLRSDAIDVSAMLRLVRQNVIAIGGAMLVGAVLLFAASYIAPKAYVVEVLVAVRPQAENSIFTQGGIGSLGSLARLVGVPDDASSKEKWFAILGGRGLGSQFIEKYELAPVLAPPPSAIRRILLSIGVVRPRDAKSEAYRVFNEKVRTVKEADRTGLITVAIKWDEPKEAARLANAYVDAANERIRDNEIRDSNRNIQYLTKTWSTSEELAIRTASASLLEAEMQRLMLARSRQDYAFEVVEAAVAPDLDRYSSPNRWIFASIGAAIGLALGFWFARRRSARFGDHSNTTNPK